MPSAISDQDLSHAVLQSIDSGVFPESEEIASSSLSQGALRNVLEGLQASRNKIEADVRKVSRDVAPNVDNWIQQAQQLQLDIERSRATAREIVQQQEQATHLHRRYEEARQKAKLLAAEVDFSKRLEYTLNQIRTVADDLSKTQDAIAHGEFEAALGLLGKAETALVDLGSAEGSSAIDLLHQRVSRLRDTFGQELEQYWNKLIKINHDDQSLTILDSVTLQDSKSDIKLNTVAEILSKLGLFEARFSQLCRELELVIVKPLLSRNGSKSFTQVAIEGRTLRIFHSNSHTNAIGVLNTITTTIQFLNDYLPSMISVLLAEESLPRIVKNMLSHWLETSVPVTLEDLDKFQALLERVSKFTSDMKGIGWIGSSELDDWIEQAPAVWLAARRQSALASLRSLLSKRIHQTKIVERVETQTVSGHEAVAAATVINDDWDAAWGEDNDEHAESQTNPILKMAEDEDEDASAWDENDPAADTADTAPSNATFSNLENPTDKADADDAWDWKEDTTNAPITPSTDRNGRDTGSSPKTGNGENSASSTHAPREVTLREGYTVTAVPDSIRDIIVQITHDASALRQPPLSTSPISPAAMALYSLPTLTLAGFRAIAPSYYQSLPIGGNMYMYNDSRRLASELQTFHSSQVKTDSDNLQHTSQSSWPSSRMKLDAEITALNSFARRAYGKEMETQRTILRDLLDAAQGFTNSTEPPFAAECDNAIAMAVDRTREVAEHWRPILSTNELLQSLGSLVSTITSKLVADICDMADISAEESVRLRELCTRVTSLSELFLQRGPGANLPEEEEQDMIHIYTAGWFKFQYLSEILDGSLADIKALWQEGMLKVDFDEEEIVGLVEALFADSDLRRKAIHVIRRG